MAVCCLLVVVVVAVTFSVVFWCVAKDQQAAVRILEPRDGSGAVEQSFAYSEMRADHGEGRGGRDELGADILPLHAGEVNPEFFFFHIFVQNYAKSYRKSVLKMVNAIEQNC